MHTHAPLVSHIPPSWVWMRPSATVYWALTVYDLWGVTFSPFSFLFILSLADFSSGHNWSWSTSSPALCLLTFSSETDLSEQAWSWRPHCPPLSNTSSTLTHSLHVKCPYQAGLNTWSQLMALFGKPWNFGDMGFSWGQWALRFTDQPPFLSQLCLLFLQDVMNCKVPPSCSYCCGADCCV